MAVTITNDAATTRTNLGLGDAATKTVGTASGNIPVLDSSGKLASGRMPTLKTVGGSSIIGSGDISTLPSGGTADQVLTSDASSNATWADAAGGGKVLQVVQTFSGNPGSGNVGASTFADIISKSITLVDANSTVLVSFLITMASSGTSDNSTPGCRLRRGSTSICVGNSTGDGKIPVTFGNPNTMNSSQRTVTYSGTFLDSPGASGSVTYTLQGQCRNAGYTFYWGRAEATNSSTEQKNYPTVITLMEIGA